MPPGCGLIQTFRRPARGGASRHRELTSEPHLPTVLRTGPYRFFFYMADYREPAHVHVERDRQRAKIWLDPVKAAYSGTFSPTELRKIQRIVEENRYVLLEQWDAYFGV
jgi:hypothetical protein